MNMGTKYISFSITEDNVTNNVEAEFGDASTWMELLYPVVSCLGAAYGYDLKDKIEINGRLFEYGMWEAKFQQTISDILDELDEEDKEELKDWTPVKPMKKKGKMKKKESFLMGRPEDWEDTE